MAKWFATAGGELIGLFVDDGSLAVALIGWVALLALVVRHFPGSETWGGGLLLLGCVAILAENVLRSASRR